MQQEVDPNPQTSELASLEGSAGGMLSDLAGAIPGIDEAMSFAEVLKQVHLEGSALPICLDSWRSRQSNHRFHFVYRSSSNPDEGVFNH